MLLEAALGRGKNPGCLSAWQVSQLALGLAEPAVVEHRRACSVCAARVQAEEKQRAAAMYEKVPSVLLTRTGSRSLWQRLRPPPRWLFWASAVFVLAGVAPLLWVHRRQPAPPPAVVASVTRDGRVLKQDVPPARLGKLRPGDKLRLRVQAKNAQWVRLEVQQGGTLWDVYYEGQVPEDGWLPAGFTVTPLNRMQLRLLACPQEPAIGAPAVPPECFVEQLDL